MQEKPTIFEKIGKLLSIAGNVILMNLLFLAASIPIVTMGQAWTGLLTAMRYQIRGDKWIAGFKKGFFTRFWRGTVMWIIMAIIDVFLMFDVIQNIVHLGFDVPTVMSCIVFAMMIMVTFALQILNVYVPTAVGQWLRNGVNMVFKAPLPLLAAAILFWLPIFLVFSPWYSIAYYFNMILIVAYFALAAAAGTLVLKEALMYYLLEARVLDILLEDDSNTTKPKEGDEEE